MHASNGLIQEIEPRRETIATPDKENAVYLAGLSIPMKDDHPDYPAVLAGNFILGGGGLSSRLADRLRQKGGLSYTAMSMFQASPLDARAEMLILAIYNPKNRDKVVTGVDEELERLVQGGVTAAELDRAKTGYLQQQAVHAHQRHDAGFFDRKRSLSRPDLDSSRPTWNRKSRPSRPRSSTPPSGNTSIPSGSRRSPQVTSPRNEGIRLIANVVPERRHGNNCDSIPRSRVGSVSVSLCGALNVNAERLCDSPRSHAPAWDRYLCRSAARRTSMREGFPCPFLGAASNQLSPFALSDKLEVDPHHNPKSLTRQRSVQPLFLGKYSPGIAWPSLSLSQKIVTVHHRFPSKKSWMLLIPRANGFGSSSARRDSYVLKTCATEPNRSTRRAISCSKNPSVLTRGSIALMKSSIE